MATLIAMRPVGPTYALSVANTQHTSVSINPTGNDQCNFASFYNSGSTQVCVVTAPNATPPLTPTLVFPLDGAPTVPNSFILPASMTQDKIISVPANGFSVSAIASAAGPAIIYVTPVGSQ